MAGTYLVNSFCKGILDSTPAAWNLGTDTIRVALATSGYTPAKTHQYMSSVTNEVSTSGTGYSRGDLTSLSVTQDDTDNEGVFDAADFTWSSSTITARYAIIYKFITNDAASPIIGIFNFGSDKISNSGDFKLQWNTEGIVNITATET